MVKVSIASAMDPCLPMHTDTLTATTGKGRDLQETDLGCRFSCSQLHPPVPPQSLFDFAFLILFQTGLAQGIVLAVDPEFPAGTSDFRPLEIFRQESPAEQTASFFVEMKHVVIFNRFVLRMQQPDPREYR